MCLLKSTPGTFYLQCGSILPCEVNHLSDKRNMMVGGKVQKDAAMMVKKQKANERI